MICKKCANDIIVVKQPTCMRCGKPLEMFEEEYCHDCEKKNFEYKRGVAAFVYSKTMKKSMYAFKYNNRREYAKFYAKTVAKNWKHVIEMWQAEALVPVPLHPKKYRKRGYNQAEVFALELSKQLGITVETKALFRIKNTRPQKELDEKNRNNNINNAFIVGNNGVRYKRLIIIDDIYTTGTTINECARILREAGVEQVYFITVCIGKGF